MAKKSEQTVKESVETKADKYIDKNLGIAKLTDPTSLSMKNYYRWGFVAGYKLAVKELSKAKV